MPLCLTRCDVAVWLVSEICVGGWRELCFCPLAESISRSRCYCMGRAFSTCVGPTVDAKKMPIVGAKMSSLRTIASPR